MAEADGGTGDSDAAGACRRQRVGDVVDFLVAECALVDGNFVEQTDKAVCRKKIATDRQQLPDRGLLTVWLITPTETPST